MSALPGPPALPTLVGFWDRHQVPLYLASLALGAAVGLAAPALGGALAPVVPVALAALLFATFLGIPLVGDAAGRTLRAVRDPRFLAGLGVANALLAPAVAFVLTRPLADDRGLLFGALLVLLCPCVDYVVVFAGLAGAAREKLLAATPLLLVAQAVLLPLYLRLFAGRDAVGDIDPAPFVTAFVLVVAAPLALATFVQWTGLRRGARAAHRVSAVTEGAMVPLMMLTLALVVAAHVDELRGDAAHLARLVPLYALFLALMAALGLATARALRQGVPEIRATMFSAATRNSLVVLPLALALPDTLSLAAAAVVTQTFVELLGMLVLVRLVPRLVPDTRVARAGD